MFHKGTAVTCLVGQRACGPVNLAVNIRANILKSVDNKVSQMLSLNGVNTI